MRHSESPTTWATPESPRWGRGLGALCSWSPGTSPAASSTTSHVGAGSLEGSSNRIATVIMMSALHRFDSAW